MDERLQIRAIDGRGAPVIVGQTPITFGRNPDNLIRLTGERASRYHCMVELGEDGGAWLKDLGSRNGTRVNEVPVRESPLNPGDLISIGGQEFIVEVAMALLDEDPAEAPPTPARQDAPATNGSGTTAPTKTSRLRRRAEPEAPSAPPAWLTALDAVLAQLPPKDEPPEPVTMLDAGDEKTDALASAGDGPRAMLAMLRVASKSRATDVHLEPKGDRIVVRMRVDGQMVWVVDLPNRVGELCGGLIKAACRMHSAARDAIQEGHFSTRFPDRRVDYRVSFTPSVHGQKMVLRVLDLRDVPRSIADLGLMPYMEERLRRSAGEDQGMILSVGPTGSGKTTTLYNVLREIDREARNVVTIEDPVEYQLPGVTQMPVGEIRGNTFGSLLRSVLRQDPDVILVGEIRDEETARTAMQASMTGHLVLSTLHARDTVSAVFRLLDLKIEPYLVANSLDLVLAQRLVRVLCENCKTEVPLKPGDVTKMGRHLMGATRAYADVGCSACLKTGFRGRRGIYELLDFNDELRDIVLTGASIQGMRRVIENGLFTTLPQFGWRLVGEGVTTIAEIDRVAGQG
ncbi:MAG: ATPase, T2SS/T4P/T4SS family [Phycisphaerales bacterium]|jgi:general secretion pathway protein E|nr:ATPase, T2SS/T4P/T4SS family [Phycisphaerales bacterium]